MFQTDKMNKPSYLRDTLLALILTFASTSNVPIIRRSHEITPPNDGTGIFYERLPDTYTMGATWKLVTYVDLTEFLAEKPSLPTKFLKEYKNCEILEDCPIVIHKKWLTTRLEQQEQLIINLKNLLPKYRKNKNDLKTKKKRKAPFSFFGKMGKIFFGTMDEDSEEEINKHLLKLQTSLTNITTITESQLQVLKSNFHKISDVFNELNKKTIAQEAHITLLSKHVNRLADNELLRIKRSSTLEILRLTEQKLNLFEQKLHTLINGIILAKEGILHPEFILPSQLKLAIDIVLANHPELIFPSSNVYADKLQSVLDITLSMNENRIIIITKIPMLNSDPLQTFRLHPLPVLQRFNDSASSFAFIKPKQKLMFLSSD